jgi:malate dehydrogenase
MYDHATMIREISQNIAKYAPEAKILMVTNPVDVLTYVIQKDGSFPSKHVIGVASSLDSGRFRYILSREFGTNQSRITNAMVLGEHDDTMVPIFSHVKFDGRPVNDILDEQKKSKITNEVRNYWKYFREYQVHSVFGIAKNTFDIIKCMIKNETLNVPASVLLDGQYGISNVCIGVPLEINKNGVAKIHQITITENESISLHKSAEVVRNNIAKVLEFLQAN